METGAHAGAVPPFGWGNDVRWVSWRRPVPSAFITRTSYCAMWHPCPPWQEVSLVSPSRENAIMTPSGDHAGSGPKLVT